MTDEPAEEPRLARAELDRTTIRDFRERIARFEAEPAAPEARTYPGYPRVALPRVRPRLLASLDRALLERRSVRALARTLPPRAAIARLLRLAHGATASEDRGPTPSAGGLQALELYLAVLEDGWLERAAYHYDRREHALARIAPGEPRAAWHERVPSLDQVEGGSVLLVIAGDTERPRTKYGTRGEHFLALEAGHLMQNLALLAASLGLALTPFGGFFEREVARTLALPPTDLVLYVGVLGTPR